ncbi:MAG: EAL domain-containing protein [Lachnospiraceae bacterium]
MDGVVVYFDYCACALLFLLLMTLVIRKVTKGHVNKLFLLLIFSAIFTCVTDIWANDMENSGIGSIMVKYAVNTLYFVSHNLALPLLTAYIISLTDTWHIIYKHKVLPVLLCLPTVLVYVALAVNLFQPVIFYFDKDNLYTRGSMFWMLYLVAGFYMIFSLIYALKFRKSLGTYRLASIIFVFALSFAAVAIQFIFPRLQIEMYCNALGLLFISVMVQRPEDTIDSDTRFYKLKAYLDTVKKVYENHKEVEIIQVNVTNYKSLREMTGYEGFSELMNKIAGILENVDNKWKLKSDIYNLGNGKVRLVIDTKSFAKTVPAAEEINEILKHDISLKYAVVGVVANVCIVNLPKDIPDVDSLMAFGDDMDSFPYSGKVQFASEIFKKRYYDIMRDIDSIIELALSENKFEVYYQPIYSVKEKRFTSAEALLRLNDEKYGFIAPDIFIPASEKSGSIHRIGSYVLEEVCKFISSDSFKKLNIDYIEVNLSVAQCMQKNLADDVMDMLNKYGVKPSQINLEVTETAVSYSHNVFMDNLTKLNNAGISLSLDDFGTGYSNMRRIALLPFSIVKLDKTFTNAEKTPNMHIVLRDTINMIKDMNMEIVVEGIETEELVRLYCDLECEYIQGYYYSKPIPKDAFTEFVMQS